MFRKMCVLIVILILSLSIVSYSEKSEKDIYHFRQCRFGMTKQQVLEIEENNPIFSDKNILVFEDNIDGINFYIIYYFVRQQLFQGSYKSKDNKRSIGNSKSDFNTLKEKLILKYGIPLDIYRNSRYVKIFKKVSIYECLWSLKKDRSNFLKIFIDRNYTISLSLSRSTENGEYTINIIYQDQILFQLYEKEQKKKENLKF